MPFREAHKMADQTRYSDETLRDYAKGRLPAAEALALEAAADADPKLAAEIALVRGVVKAGEADAGRASSSELGWARLSRAIDAESRKSPSFVPKQFSRWQVAAVAAVAVAVWSIAAGPLLQRGAEPGDGYVAASERPAYAHSAQATFVPTAQESAIREALRFVDAEIVKGPSALGVYVLAFKDAEALSGGVETLRARTDVFESVRAN
jgi:anti-sigma-K factor RskA